MQRNFFKSSCHFLIAAIFLVITSCDSNSNSSVDKRNILKGINDQSADSSILIHVKKQNDSMQIKIGGQWYQEEDKSQKLFFIKDSLYETTELGANAYRYTLSKYGIVDGDTIICSKNEHFLSYYRNDTLQYSYVIINFTDSTISLMSPINAQVVIYRRNK